MKKDVSYRDQLIELSKLYKVPEVKSYLRSKKNLTTSQLELILLKNKIPLPANSYNRKQVAQIKFKEQVITNIVLTFNTDIMFLKPVPYAIDNNLIQLECEDNTTEHYKLKSTNNLKI